MQLQDHQTDSAPDTRAEALRRLTKRRELADHVISYALVNMLLWGLWIALYITAGVRFPWPIFVTFGWGIGLALHVWDVYWRRPTTERDKSSGAGPSQSLTS